MNGMQVKQAGRELLSCHGLTKRFGGLVAVDRVDLSVSACSVHAVIGTNGAGKSTLLNMLAGEIRSDGGDIRLNSQPVTRLSQPARAHAGLGRTYQRNTLFENLTILENCRLAAQGNRQRAWAFLQPATRCEQSIAVAEEAIERVGLAGSETRVAHTLSHGQKRQLEIAMCLAQEPTVMLLDEPLAGMGAEESETILCLLSSMKKTHGILLVEHDMPAVFRLADEVTVMVHGKVIASGVPEQVRNNPEVISAYLGEGEHV